jgi:hypothetical protein
LDILQTMKSDAENASVESTKPAVDIVLYLVSEDEQSQLWPVIIKMHIRLLLSGVKMYRQPIFVLLDSWEIE